jgi:hypothetical protein
MRIFLVIVLLALVGAGVYGYFNNPAACRKLGTEVVADLTTIFKPGSGGSSDASSADAQSAPGSTANSQPRHWKQGFVTETDSETPAPVPEPMPASATGGNTPQSYLNSDFTAYGPALEASRERHRPLVILFTGTDWSIPSQLLDREVISTGQFEQYKDTHFVLLTVNDLHDTTVLDDEKTTITELETKFHITEFPTLVVLGSDEQELGRIIDYTPGGGASNVEEHLHTFLKN